MYLPKEVLEYDSDKAIIQHWKLIARTSKENRELLQKQYYQLIITCADKSEILKMDDIFREDQISNSMSYQYYSIQSFYKEQYLLKRNLCNHPRPAFDRALKAWTDDPNCPDSIEKNADNTINLFAPCENETICQAWEKTIKKLSDRKHRKVEHFLKLYLEELQKDIFKNLDWNSEDKNIWLREWKNKLLNRDHPHASSPCGRWHQGNPIDVITAGKFIIHFIKKFISNPEDLKSGETVCILWILLQCSLQKMEGISIDDVLHLTSDNFLDNGRLRFHNKELNISLGLQKHLKCLFGKGSGLRKQRIFKNTKNRKSLERQLKEASEFILGKDALAVSPQAFLSLPHLWENLRPSKKSLEAMRTGR